MPTPRSERETTITYNEEEDTALVWSASLVFQRRMDRLGVIPYHTSIRDPETGDASRSYRVPKKWVKVSSPRKGKELTEEERERLRVRLSAFRRQKQGYAGVFETKKGILVEKKETA